MYRKGTFKYPLTNILLTGTKESYFTFICKSAMYTFFVLAV